MSAPAPLPPTPREALKRLLDFIGEGFESRSLNTATLEQEWHVANKALANESPALKWPVSSGGFHCTFETRSARCESTSGQPPEPGGRLQCCLRGEHEGTHLHCTGWAWSKYGETPIRVALVPAQEVAR